MKKNISYEEVHKLLVYEPLTGLLRWGTSRGKIKKGAIAGGKNIHGYYRVKINGKDYISHRLIWFMVYGYFPEHGIDHINGVRSDNRIENLREVSQQCNVRNMHGCRRDNCSGITGVG